MHFYENETEEHKVGLHQSKILHMFYCFVLGGSTSKSQYRLEQCSSTFFVMVHP